MDNYKLISKVGAAMAVVCILFLPFVGCGGVNITGLEVIQDEGIWTEVKIFVIASIACGVLIFFLKEYLHMAWSAIGGIVTLLIAYFIAREKSEGAIGLRIGAFLAILGFVVTTVTSFLKQSQKRGTNGQ